jgi:hypothetical protein
MAKGNCHKIKGKKHKENADFHKTISRHDKEEVKECTVFRLSDDFR